MEFTCILYVILWLTQGLSAILPPCDRGCRIRGGRGLRKLNETLVLVLLSVHDLYHLVEQYGIFSLNLPLPLFFNPVQAVLTLALLRSASRLVLRRLLLQLRLIHTVLHLLG